MERKLKIQERNTVIGTKLERKNFRPMNYRFKPHNHVRKDGLVTLSLFISHAGNSQLIPIQNVFINPKKWDKNKQRLKVRTTTDATTNSVLDEIEKKILHIKTKYARDGSILTTNKFVEEYLHFNANFDFIIFMEVELEKEQGVLKPGPYRYIKGVISKLKMWKKEIYFKDIEPSWIDEFKGFCRGRGNSTNTISRNIRVLKKYLKKAIKKGIRINLDLDEVSTPNKETNRVDLTITEVRHLLMEYYKNHLPLHEQHALGLFLFSCFTGLRWDEINNFTPAKIYNKYIVIFQEKTENPLRIPLTVEARELINTIDWNRKISYQKSLDYLKKAVKKLGITKKVGFHVGRHTFSTNYIRTDGNVVRLQRLLGHKKISTTQIYVHMTGMENDDHIHKLSSMYSIGSGLQ